MIIDSHMHFGKIGNFNINSDEILSKIKEKNVNIGIVSSVECCEFPNGIYSTEKNEITQIDANKKLLNFLKKNKNKIFGAFWCKPFMEQNIEQVKSFLCENKDYFVALKIHPYYSNLAIEDERYETYFNLAKELNLPVCVHTAGDNLSSPRQLFNIAKSHNEIKFVMVHMGLCTDNEQAIECVKNCENLFGDTTWVENEKVLKSVKVCGEQKIMFGSDAPIGDGASYEFYTPLLENKIGLSKIEFENLMYFNAKRIFGLKI